MIVLRLVVIEGVRAENVVENVTDDHHQCQKYFCDGLSLIMRKKEKNMDLGRISNLVNEDGSLPTMDVIDEANKDDFMSAFQSAVERAQEKLAGMKKLGPQEILARQMEKGGGSGGGRSFRSGGAGKGDELGLTKDGTLMLQAFKEYFEKNVANEKIDELPKMKQQLVKTLNKYFGGDDAQRLELKKSIDYVESMEDFDQFMSEFTRWLNSQPVDEIHDPEMRKFIGKELEKAASGPYDMSDLKREAEKTGQVEKLENVRGNWLKRAEEVGWDSETGYQYGWTTKEDDYGNVVEEEDPAMRAEQGRVLEELKKEFLTLMYAQLYAREAILKSEEEKKGKKQDPEAIKRRMKKAEAALKRWYDEMEILTNEMHEGLFPFAKFFNVVYSIILKGEGTGVINVWKPMRELGQSGLKRLGEQVARFKKEQEKEKLRRIEKDLAHQVAMKKKKAQEKTSLKPTGEALLNDHQPINESDEMTELRTRISDLRNELDELNKSDEDEMTKRRNEMRQIYDDFKSSFGLTDEEFKEIIIKARPSIEILNKAISDKDVKRQMDEGRSLIDIIGELSEKERALKHDDVIDVKKETIKEAQPITPPQRDYSELPNNPAHDFKLLYDKFAAKGREISDAMDAGKLVEVTPEEYQETKDVWLNAIRARIGHGISNKNAEKVFTNVAKIEKETPDLQKRFVKMLSYGTNWLMKAMGLGIESLIDDALDVLLEKMDEELTESINETIKRAKILTEAGEAARKALWQLTKMAKLSNDTLHEMDVMNVIKQMAPDMEGERLKDFYEAMVDGLMIYGIEVIRSKSN